MDCQHAHQCVSVVRHANADGNFMALHRPTLQPSTRLSSGLSHFHNCCCYCFLHSSATLCCMLVYRHQTVAYHKNENTQLPTISLRLCGSFTRSAYQRIPPEPTVLFIPVFNSSNFVHK